uniref:G_PROTEIN_RECEP_F3_4 domain-containing protein n=1 Tax=Syphacia muris TaxID=451379 RepID=A0A0N5AV20_9BILA
LRFCLQYQIGGAFPFHYTDCSQLRPESVQDIVAIQWALTHWNQNPENAAAKIGLFAGDTCSRPKEAISQSLRFLDSIGYHEPDECVSLSDRQNISKLLGLIMPKDDKSSRALSTLLNSAQLPIVAYSSASANALLEMNINNVITTAPTLTIFTEAFVKLMANLRSNLITVVINDRRSAAVKRVIEQIRSHNIFISDIISINKPGFLRELSESDSQIILSLIDKQEMTSLAKMWIAITVDGDGLSSEEQLKVLHKGSRVQVISLQSRQKDLPQFRQYFLRVLKNNYQSYSLLASYMQQNCAELTRDDMNSIHTQASTVESAVRMTYALSAVGAKLHSIPSSEIICDRPSPKCTEMIVKELERLDYKFGPNDPQELIGERLQFYRNSDNHLVASGITIEGIELINDEKMGPMVYKVIEYETGRYPRLVTNNFRQSRLRSVCAPYRSFCGRCEHITRVNPKRYFLSIPKQYPLYLMALFNFHEAPDCNTFKNYDISLPMAFVHTIWTFRQRFPQLNLLRNLEFGALLVDACSSSKKAIEIIVQSENQCFAFEQSDRNITVVPGSVFGYISGLHGTQHEALSGFFATGDVPLIALDSDRKSTIDEFSTMPSAKYQALALLKLLKKLKWEFISVVLSEQDSVSLASFRHFERIAADRGVCLAEVINMSGEHLPDLSASSSTNATVLFTTADDAAMYFAARFKRESSVAHAHVVVGDAHDFHLRDPSNVAKFVGTVSLQPKDVLYTDFRQWLEMTTPLTLPEDWYWKHVEHRWQCALSEESKDIYGGKMCTGEELLDIENLGRMTKSGYLSRGIEKLLFAMDSVYKKLCPEQNGMCVEFFNHGRKQILNALKKVHTEDEFEIYEFLPDAEGTFSYQVIGNWSIKTGLRFDNIYKKIVSRCIPPLCSCFADKDFFTSPMQMAISSSGDMDAFAGSYIRREPTSGTDKKVQYESVCFPHLTTGNWRKHSWNYVFLVLNSVFLFGSLSVLALVCMKLYLRVVKGNQSLGISLLIGIIMLYVTAYFFIFDPTDLVCRARVTMHSLGYTLCFGVMIAKATQLRNAETLGFSSTVHISYWNYWLLLFFVIGVQIALSVHWLAEQYMSTLILNGYDMQMACTFGDQEFLLSQTYVVVLLTLALFVNSRNRNIKRNYKETKWLFLSSLVCLLLWMLWMGAYLTVPVLFKDVVVILELMACATVLLAFLFGPKIYILLSYEPVVVEYQGPNSNSKDLVYENGLFEKGILVLV